MKTLIRLFALLILVIAHAEAEAEDTTVSESPWAGVSEIRVAVNLDYEIPRRDEMRAQMF